VFFVLQDLKFFVFLLVFFEDFEGIVFGVVINGNNFNVGVALTRKGLQTLREELARIVNGHNN
jgi:hypothetical protein